MLQKQHKVNLQKWNFELCSLTTRPQDLPAISTDLVWMVLGNSLDDVTGFRIAPMTSQRCLHSEAAESLKGALP